MSARLYLHFALLHRVNQLQLALGDLDDLLNETGANLLLNVVDPSHARLATLMTKPLVPEV